MLRVKLSELRRYYNRVGALIEYYFDRKTYAVVDAETISLTLDEPYQRYIPLYQIDEEQLQDDYINSWNDKKMLYEYEHAPYCFEAFIQRRSLANNWWRFYCKQVSYIAVSWCEEHHIKYEWDIN